MIVLIVLLSLHKNFLKNVFDGVLDRQLKYISLIMIKDVEFTSKNVW
jgi:hypothetical protein